MINLTAPQLTLVSITLTAFLAGSFSILSLTLSKEQKVSEFRQEWINKLRDSISNYISAAYYIHSMYELNRKQDIETKKSNMQMAVMLKESYSTMNTAYNDIIFRINGNEKSSKVKDINSKFLSVLEESRKQYNQGVNDTGKKALDDIRNVAKPLLKIEWERVKKGEPHFRALKLLSMLCIVAGFAIAIYFIYTKLL